MTNDDNQRYGSDPHHPDHPMNKRQDNEGLTD